MSAALLGLLSRDEAGLWLAALLAAAGLALWPAHAAPALVLLATSALMTAGAAWHLRCVARLTREHPSPGRTVRVGTVDVHLHAEGAATGRRPAVLWIGGGHGPGTTMHHLHERLRPHTRSILVDRPATGWSGVAPFPRRTAGEATELWQALDAAGETAPLVLVGHSFGGLLAACMARQAPQRVAALVLLDATPPELVVFGPRLQSLQRMAPLALATGLARLVGWHDTPWERRHREQPAYAEVMRRVRSAMGDAYALGEALGLRARGHFAAASIYRELTPEGMAGVGWATVPHSGELDALRVCVVAPGHTAEDVAALPEAQSAAAVELRRMERFFARARDSWLRVSCRAERVVTPAGTGHNFPYEVPDFVAALVRAEVERALQEAPDAR